MSADITPILQPEDNSSITLAVDNGHEVLKFEKNRVWVYGQALPPEKCTDEVIQAFLDFVKFLRGKL